MDKQHLSVAFVDKLLSFHHTGWTHLAGDTPDFSRRPQHLGQCTQRCSEPMRKAAGYFRNIISLDPQKNPPSELLVPGLCRRHNCSPGRPGSSPRPSDSSGLARPPSLLRGSCRAGREARLHHQVLAQIRLRTCTAITSAWSLTRTTEMLATHRWKD